MVAKIILRVKPLPLTSVVLMGLSTVKVFCMMWSGLIPSSSSKGGSSSNPDAPEGATYEGEGCVSGMNMAPVYAVSTPVDRYGLDWLEGGMGDASEWP